MARLPIVGLALTIALAACSPTSSSATTEDSSTTTAPTTTTTETTTTTVPSLDVPVESAYGAFCAGMISGTASFSEGMEGVEYFDLFREATWFDCMDVPREFVYDEADRRGVSFDDLPFDTAYVWGCTIPARQWDIETFGPYVDDSFPDTETRKLFNEAACAGPFTIAFDAGWEWEILRRGVCYHMDFTPTGEQIESGMVPCP